MVYSHRLAFSTYCELAQVYGALSKQPSPHKHTPDLTVPNSVGTTLTKSPSPATDTVEQEREHMRSSPRRPSRGTGSKQSPNQDGGSKLEREWTKERARDSYLAWVMIKTAQYNLDIMRNLQILVSEFHKEENTKQISDKILEDLSDFALLELCPQVEYIQLLTYSSEVPPIEMLSPSTQCTCTTGFNWFKIAGYFNTLLQQCYWQKAALNLSHSQWGLHYHTLTPLIYPKCRALLSFLNTHCQQFAKTCKLPPLPVPLVLQPSQQKRTSSAGVSISAQPGGGSPLDCYLTAVDAELTVLWTKPFLVPSRKEYDSNVNDFTVGYFAMNLKSVRTLNPGNLGSYGFESQVVTVSTTSLTELYTLWEDVALSTKAFLDTKPIVRPISRSPSKQKKSEKGLKVPPELVKRVEDAVYQLAEVFNLKMTKEQLPKLELHSVVGVAKILEPFSSVTAKGDVYYFFKSLFSAIP